MATAMKPEMYAYPDTKCVYGYMTVHHECKSGCPSWVDISRPITNPPALNKVQRCEICDRSGLLVNPRGH